MRPGPAATRAVGDRTLGPGLPGGSKTSGWKGGGRFGRGGARVEARRTRLEGTTYGRVGKRRGLGREAGFTSTVESSGKIKRRPSASRQMTTSWPLSSLSIVISLSDVSSAGTPRYSTVKHASQSQPRQAYGRPGLVLRWQRQWQTLRTRCGSTHHPH